MIATQLSPHFSLAEFTRSATADHYKIDNTPTAEHLENLRQLSHTLEEVRAFLGFPLLITSGYRSPALNRAVDGSSTSSHCHGLAADFHCPGFGSDLKVCHALAKSGIKFDQLIFEQGKIATWVHLGIGDKLRQEVLSWRSGKGFRSGVVNL